MSYKVSHVPRNERSRNSDGATTQEYQQDENISLSMFHYYLGDKNIFFNVFTGGKLTYDIVYMDNGEVASSNKHEFSLPPVYSKYHQNSTYLGDFWHYWGALVYAKESKSLILLLDLTKITVQFNFIEVDGSIISLNIHGSTLAYATNEQRNRLIVMDYDAEVNGIVNRREHYLEYSIMDDVLHFQHSWVLYNTVNTQKEACICAYNYCNTISKEYPLSLTRKAICNYGWVKINNDCEHRRFTCIINGEEVDRYFSFPNNRRCSVDETISLCALL
ncbi:hypothetical protein PCE1_004908 [Barthelona sp. PCE]